MKKVLLILTLVSIVTGLAACQKESSPLVISKIFDATIQANNIIELYNPSEEDIDLKNYALDFYTNGSEEVSKTIPLSGVISANAFFAIGSSNALDTANKALYDFVFEEGSLPFNGNDSIVLTLNGDNIDFVGFTGLDVDFAKDLTMIRLGEKADYQPSAVFDAFNFIYYLPDMFQYLKNDTHEIKTLEQLYAGPQLEDRYKSMPYVDPNNATLGGGGAVLSLNSGVADGDTAYFSANAGFGGGSVRYFYINTPEVDGTFVSAEPWGYVASKYNKQYLLSNPTSKEIYIQSIKGYALQEVHGRNIALVWVNGHLSQFMLVAEGLSEDVGMKYSSYDLEMHYKNVPYLTFLRFAEHRAKVQGWGTKGYPANPAGEKSPDWNYDSNQNTTTNPVWTPHLPLPWN